MESFDITGDNLWQDSPETAYIILSKELSIKASFFKVDERTMRVFPVWDNKNISGIDAYIVIVTKYGEFRSPPLSVIRPGFDTGDFGTMTTATLKNPQWLYIGKVSSNDYLLSFDAGGVRGTTFDSATGTLGTVSSPFVAAQAWAQPAELDNDMSTDIVAVDRSNPPPQQLGTHRAVTGYVPQGQATFGVPWLSESITALSAGSYDFGRVLVALTTANQKLYNCLINSTPYAAQPCVGVAGFSSNVRSFWVSQLGANKADILVLDAGGTLQLWRADSSNIFTNQSAVLGSDLAGRNIVAVALADVNSNTGTDIVAVDALGIVVLLNNGQGSFTANTTPVAKMPLPRSIMLGDVNGDEKPDIILTDKFTGILTFFLNGGTSEPPERRWLGPVPLLDAKGGPITLGAEDVAIMDGVPGMPRRRIVATDVSGQKIIVWQNRVQP